MTDTEAQAWAILAGVEAALPVGEAHDLHARIAAALTAAAERERVLREALEAAVAYVREWPIGVDTDPQEQRGGARDTMLANLRAALEATK